MVKTLNPRGHREHSRLQNLTAVYPQEGSIKQSDVYLWQLHLCLPRLEVQCILNQRGPSNPLQPPFTSQNQGKKQVSGFNPSPHCTHKTPMCNDLSIYKPTRQDAPFFHGYQDDPFLSWIQFMHSSTPEKRHLTDAMSTSPTHNSSAPYSYKGLGFSFLTLNPSIDAARQA